MGSPSPYISSKTLMTQASTPPIALTALSPPGFAISSSAPSSTTPAAASNLNHNSSQATTPNSHTTASYQPSVSSRQPAPLSRAHARTSSSHRHEGTSWTAWLGIVFAVGAFVAAWYYGQLMLRLARWTAAKDFRETCISDRNLGYPTSEACNDTLLQPLDPPQIWKRAENSSNSTAASQAPWFGPFIQIWPALFVTRSWHGSTTEIDSYLDIITLQIALILFLVRRRSDQSPTVSLPLRIWLWPLLSPLVYLLGIAYIRPATEESPIESRDVAPSPHVGEVMDSKPDRVVLLVEALPILTSAVELDKAGDYCAAIKAYIQGCGLLQQVYDLSADIPMRRQLKERIKEYKERTEKLDRFVKRTPLLEAVDLLELGVKHDHAHEYEPAAEAYRMGCALLEQAITRNMPKEYDPALELAGSKLQEFRERTRKLEQYLERTANS